VADTFDFPAVADGPPSQEEGFDAEVAVVTDEIPPESEEVAPENTAISPEESAEGNDLEGETSELDDTADSDEIIEINEEESVEDAGFAALNLRPELNEALTKLGYEQPTPIQREAIPVLLTGVDVVGKAATGTGKTAAFALPILQNVAPGREAFPTALVLAPTRELASQVAEAFRSYGNGFKVRVAELIGGQPIGPQIGSLKKNPNVIVATPGRAIDHLGRGTLVLDGVSTVVLDEADEMLDMGFAEDIELLLDHSPSTRQTVLFSATMPPRINALIKKHLNDPQRISVEVENDGDKPLIEQRLYVVKKMHKAAAVARVLNFEQPGSAIIFCRTRSDVDELAVALNQRNYRAEALHGGMDQQQRERVMGRLRDGTAQLLVATDVAARGLDVSTLTHVINHDVPTAPESYLHRIGRVGRAGRTGTALTFATPHQHRLVGNIERLVGDKIPVHRIPKAEDIAKQRQDRLVDELRETLASPDLDDQYSVLNELKGDATDRQVALAALHLLRRSASTVADSDHVPDASASYERDATSKGQRGGKGKHRNDRDRKGRDRDRNKAGGHKGGDRPAREIDPNTAFVYVGVGNRGGVRPGDLVGAIANETGIPGRDVGPIRIHDHYSVVGVPDKSVDDVIKAINRSTVKGKKAKARRYVTDDRDKGGKQDKRKKR